MKEFACGFSRFQGFNKHSLVFIILCRLLVFRNIKWDIFVNKFGARLSNRIKQGGIVDKAKYIGPASYNNVRFFYFNKFFKSFKCCFSIKWLVFLEPYNFKFYTFI